MQFELHQAKPYTFLSVPYPAGPVRRHEIVIMSGMGPERIYRYRPRNGRQIYYLPAEGEIDTFLFFEGHDLPFMLDDETPNPQRNSCFNFVTDQPTSLRYFILRYCLNPRFNNFLLILYSGYEDIMSGFPKPRLLFPECTNQSRLGFHYPPRLLRQDARDCQ
jgi:hypothetical protein